MAQSDQATKRLLLVDDSPASRQLTRQFLDPLGLQVDEADDGESAWDLVCSRRPYDLIIVDWHMPEMNGRDLCKLIRDNPLLSDTQLIMLTVEMTRSVVIEALRIGVNAYIAKPLTQAVLYEKLQSLKIISEVPSGLS